MGPGLMQLRSDLLLAFYEDIQKSGSSRGKHAVFLVLILSPIPAGVLFWLQDYYDSALLYKLVTLTSVAFTGVDLLSFSTNTLTNLSRTNSTFVISECHFHCLEEKANSSKALWRYVS